MRALERLRFIRFVLFRFAEVVAVLVISGGDEGVSPCEFGVYGFVVFMAGEVDQVAGVQEERVVLLRERHRGVETLHAVAKMFKSRRGEFFLAFDFAVVDEAEVRVGDVNRLKRLRRADFDTNLLRFQERLVGGEKRGDGRERRGEAKARARFDKIAAIELHKRCPY